jgi:c-di-GMP-binding flagellar brake protein YcgR
MSGYAALAQIFWSAPSGGGQTLRNQAATSTVGTVILVIVVLGVLIFAIAKASGQGGLAGRSSGFNRAAFRRAARDAGLEEEEVRTLEEYARIFRMSNPDFVFGNAQKIDSFFKEAYRQIDKIADSDADAEDRKSRLFAARERLTHVRAQGAPIRSTRQLGRGTPLTFIAPGEESYPSIIMAVEPGGMAVEPVADSYGESMRFKRGTKLTCYFYAKGHKGYQFATRVSGWERLGGKEVMVLGHSESVAALPARKQARREMRAPCTFYRVAVTASKVRGKSQSAARVENIPFPGTIVDISAGGLGIQSASALGAGEYIKIAFNPGGGVQAAFGKVIRMNRAKAVGGIMHVQFVKISRRSLNAILSFVYGYGD